MHTHTLTSGRGKPPAGKTFPPPAPTHTHSHLREGGKRLPQTTTGGTNSLSSEGLRAEGESLQEEISFVEFLAIKHVASIVRTIDRLHRNDSAI